MFFRRLLLLFMKIEIPVMQIYISFWDCKTDFLLIKPPFNLFIYRKFKWPVVCALRPGPRNDIHSILTQLQNFNQHLRLRQHTIILTQDLPDQNQCSFNILFVGNRNFKIDTTGFKPVQVLDLCTPDFRIGHGDSDIVEGVHLSGEEANLIDDSHRTVYTDRISYPERAKRENHNTGSNIAQRPLKSEAYCQSRSTQYCDDTCGFHSELSQHSQQCDDQNKTRVTCERIGASVLTTFSDDVAQSNVFAAPPLATIYPAIRISTAPTIFNPYSTISGRRLSLYSFTRSCIVFILIQIFIVKVDQTVISPTFCLFAARAPDQGTMLRFLSFPA